MQMTRRSSVLVRSVALLGAVACSPPDHVMSRAGAPEDAVCPPAAAETAPAAGGPAPTPVDFVYAEHAFTAKDLLAFDRISDPQVSADGKRVVFVVRTTDVANDRGRTDLWITSVDGGKPLVLAEHPDADMSPRWGAKGGEVYFISRRSGSSQVWVVDADGGEPRQITDLPVDVGAFLLSPDGERLAFTAEAGAGCDTVECSAQLAAEERARRSSGMVYDELFARHWDTWKRGTRSHLYVVPIAGGAAVDVTAGLDADVPSKPFGGDEEIAFTPDGAHLVYTARVAGREEPWSTNFDLFKVPVGGGEAINLTADNPAWDTQPVFSPDGGHLAYLAMSRPGFEADRFRIMLRAWPDGETREVAPEWDRSPGSLVFSADGKTLYATADDLGNHPLFAIDVASGAVTKVVGDGYVASPRLAGDQLVFTRDDLRAPAEVYRVKASGGAPEAITSINGERLRHVRMGEPEQFKFAGWKKEEVHGWVVKPADFDPAKKYPVAFLIHGGPQGSFGNHFHYRWNPQVYAGAGYAAVMIDFHGSTGYGQRFTDAISGDWGGKPLDDLKRGLGHATATYPWLDDDRVCALGASYGGFMINWIAGQWSDRFRCLVNHDGVFDSRMMYYATDELWFAEWEQGGPYWKNEKGHERHNPVRFVDRWKTPMLVIHGSLDYRIPETQGLGAFTALQRRGVPSRLVVFPDENHWVLKPSNSLQWHDQVLEWLDAWTREDG